MEIRLGSTTPSSVLTLGMERSHPGIYDRIGVGYRRQRRPDPRIAAQIHRALGDARRVCNVGAGAGSYEPEDREVVAVEPSLEMVAQRPPGPVVRARAEALPFADRSFDAATALLTIHHWEDVERGLQELRRIAPLRLIFTFDPLRQDDFWLVGDYLPEIQVMEEKRSPTIDALCDMLGDARVEVVPVPWDCTDGFQAAYWRRPERYLDPQVQQSISTLALLPEATVQRAIARLAEDLESGAWTERYGHLLERESMDYAYRLIVSDAR
ncbi:MAG: class I SAM-dependent methyltransferase [Myxococcales bacterium]|nr:class I SAM-dependent methyltransferase [Myxococcales bacterium]